MAITLDAQLTIHEQQALQDFVAFLHQIAPDQIVSIALFGSKSRGDSTPDSDIDVLIILNREDRRLRREISRQAARISLAHDVILSPRVIGAERWREMRDFSLYKNIQRESVKLDFQDDVQIDKAA